MSLAFFTIISEQPPLDSSFILTPPPPHTHTHTHTYSANVHTPHTFFSFSKHISEVLFFKTAGSHLLQKTNKNFHSLIQTSLHNYATHSCFLTDHKNKTEILDTSLLSCAWASPTRNSSERAELLKILSCLFAVCVCQCKCGCACVWFLLLLFSKEQANKHCMPTVLYCHQHTPLKSSSFLWFNADGQGHSMFCS